MQKKWIFILLTIFSIACNRSGKIESIRIESFDEIEILSTLKFEKISEFEIKNQQYPFIFHFNNKLLLWGINSNNIKTLCFSLFNESLSTVWEKDIPLGQGPGDLGEVLYAFFDGTYLYFADSQNRKIQKFDQLMNFIERDDASVGLSCILVNPDTYIVSRPSQSYSPPGNVFNFLVINKKENSMVPFYISEPSNPKDSKKRTVWGKKPHIRCFYRNNSIYLLLGDTYEIIQYSLSGAIKRHIRINKEIKPVPSESSESWLQEQIGKNTNGYVLIDYIKPVSEIIPLEKGFVVTHRSGYGLEDNGFCEGDYFDFNLSPIGKTKIPTNYRSNYLDSRDFNVIAYNKGFFFCITERNDQYFIEKWKVLE